MTEHFTLEELIYSKTAITKKLDNTPPDPIKKNLQVLAEGLEKIRSILGTPMNITSAYRNKILNNLVGGVDTSDHMSGYAADFVSPKFGSVADICKKIKESGIKLDQCINEYGRWVHVSFSPRMRNQHLKFTS